MTITIPVWILAIILGGGGLGVGYVGFVSAEFFLAELVKLARARRWKWFALALVFESTSLGLIGLAGALERFAWSLVMS